jgi:integrase
MRSWRSAWRGLTKAAGLKGFRFHDLRHQAITELAEIGLSDQTIMSIAGHVSKEMLNHYSHIRMAAKRKGLDSMEAQWVEDSQVTPAVATGSN